MFVKKQTTLEEYIHDVDEDIPQSLSVSQSYINRDEVLKKKREK